MWEPFGWLFLGNVISILIIVISALFGVKITPPLFFIFYFFLSCGNVDGIFFSR